MADENTGVNADVKNITGGDDADNSVDDILGGEEVNEDEPVVEEEKEEEEEEEEEEEVEEVEEEEIKEEVKEDEKPLDQKLKDVDKDIFKKVPELRKMVFEHKEFGKLFTSVDEAKDAVDKVEVFDQVEASLLDGNPQLLVRQLAQNAPEALVEFGKNFLPLLAKTNQNAYDAAIAPVFRNLIRAAYNAGVQTKNESLQRSAKHLANFLFDSPDIPGPEKVDPAKQKLEEQRQTFEQERFNSFRGELKEQVESILGGEIEKQLPKTVSPALKKVIIHHTLLAVGERLNKDENFTRKRDSYFRKAARSAFAGEWRPRILSVYLGHAKNLLPAVLPGVTKELLGSIPKESGKKGKPKRITPGGTNQGGRGKVLDGRKIDWSKTSPEKFLEEE